MGRQSTRDVVLCPMESNPADPGFLNQIPACHRDRKTKPTYPLVKATGQVRSIDNPRFLRTFHVKRLSNPILRRASSSMIRVLCHARGRTERHSFMYSFPALGPDNPFCVSCELFSVSPVISTKSLLSKFAFFLNHGDRDFSFVVPSDLVV